MTAFYILGALLLLLGVLIGYARSVTHLAPPRPGDRACEAWERREVAPGHYTLGPNWLRREREGFYTLYVTGRPYERGVVNGKLARELIVLQEDYFNEQIVRMVPSKGYLRFLKYFVGWFNRNLPRHVTEEYKQEIYGISRSASERYSYIGTPYQRILNYHAAHDIGHALQNLALVGCTSFGTWGSASEDGALLIGRNFDFYLGDHFALNKIVQFEAPSEGYRFLFVTWGGFIGVVSGMNEKGLTVTINAARSGTPLGSATPVSLVAREILQYAATIDQAVRIAGSRHMFVSESFLVGSAIDGRAVLLEKTPRALEVYDPGGERIVCANHFQSEGLKEDSSASASPYRQQRLEELLDGLGPNTVEKTIGVLRDFRGLGGRDIGLGNEKALNQFIGHHSIVFEPERLRVWVSTSPWQEGAFLCYDLREAFGGTDPTEAFASATPGGAFGGAAPRDPSADVPADPRDASADIPADPFMETRAFSDFLRFRALKHQMDRGEKIDPDALVACDPEYFQAYVLAGDYLLRHKETARAKVFYEQALTKEIATAKEEVHIRKQLKRCEA